MEEMIYLGQTDGFESQYGWQNVDDMTDEEIEMERERIEQSLEDDYINYDEETLKMLSELSRLAHELFKRGVPQKRINEEVRVFPDLKDIFITRDYRILIPECNNAEIVLQPKAKALYFLFLRHKDGLYRTDLPDYEDELIMIMKAITNKDELTTSKSRAIKKLIDKTDSSFDDSCNDIRKEFEKVLDKESAEYYCIHYENENDKLRGIMLPRNYVKVDEPTC